MPEKRRCSRRFRVSGRALTALVILLVAIGGTGVFLPAASLPSETIDRQPPQTTVHLYFATADQLSLTSENRVIVQENDPAAFGRAIIGALVEGSREELMRTLPEETVLRGFFIANEGTAYVDFTGSIRKYHPGGCGPEWLSVYSIVNSLILNIDRIRAVKVLIDGQEAQTLAGHIDLRFPFSANMLIMR